MEQENHILVLGLPESGKTNIYSRTVVLVISQRGWKQNLYALTQTYRRTEII